MTFVFVFCHSERCFELYRQQSAVLMILVKNLLKSRKSKHHKDIF